MAVDAVTGRRYEGKAAVVTGGASGIGRAIVRRIVAEGGRVAVGDINEEGLAALEGELGAAVAVVRTDVRSEDAVAALVAEAVRAFGRLDVGFNAACGGRPANESAEPSDAGGGIVSELGEGAWSHTLSVCLTGCFFSVKHEARQMIEQGQGGAIVNISSLNSQVPLWGGSPYCVAKAGVEMLTKNAALELGDHAIRVNAISPGLIETPMSAPVMAIPGATEAYLERIPLRRVGKPEEIAATAAFLGSDEASYLSGENIFVDGAWAQSGYPDMRPIMAKLLQPSRPSGA